MFCTECGCQLGAQDRFCGRCGKSLTVNKVGAVDSPVASAKVPPFGALKAKWWGTTRVASPFLAPYDWLNGKVTLHVFDRHFMFLSGTEQRSGVANAMTSGVMAAFGLAGAAVGGAVGLARSAKDKIGNSLESQLSAKSQSLFDSGEMVWCVKNDAEIWLLKQKSFLGYPTSARYALSCNLHSTGGTIRFLFPLSQTQETLFDPYKGLGCETILKGEKILEKDMDRAFDDLFRTYPSGMAATP